MCRFVCYMGQSILLHQLIFETQHSLIEQSKYARKRPEPVNGDGFGIGWYPDYQEPEFYDPNPGVFRSIEPAWSNRNLFYLTSKIRSPVFFAHIRDASPELPVSQTNCHPFHFGPFMWMHNGWLEGFSQMKKLIVNHLSERAFVGVQGNTDSEYAFAMFLDEINFNEQASEQEIENALMKVLDKLTYLRVKAGLKTNAQLNFAVTNGQVMYATRFSTLVKEEPASLYYKHGNLQKDLLGNMRITPGENKPNNSLTIASEPLSDDDSTWQEVKRNHFLKTNRQGEFEELPISAVDDSGASLRFG